MNKIFTLNSKNLLRAKFNDERKESCLCSNKLLFVFGKIIILVLFMLGSNACAKLNLIFPTSTIPMPAIEQLSATNDTKQTRSAILAAVHFKKWKVADESEGQIDVVRQGKARMAAIRITYDEYVVELHYLRSGNFECEPKESSCATIHRVYGQWVASLWSGIKHELDFAQIPPELLKETEETVELSRPKAMGSGTGFVVSRLGHVLTNHHVVDGCTTIRARTAGRMHLLTVVGTDENNDLAVLTLPAPVSGVARFRAGHTIRPGDSVVVVGFPLHGLLASEANVTTGSVSALAGIGNDTRYLQITAPVQSGNSGGPLLDAGGHIVGLVVSKLDAIYIAKVTGDIPQNINFAIKGTVAKSFLDSQSVEYETETSSNTLEFADIGSAAKQFTLLLECLR